MSRHRRVACALVCALVASLSTVGPQHAEAAGGLRISAPGAIPGAAIDLFAKGLEGKRTRVKIGGVRAKVLSGNKRKVHVLVPEVPLGDQPVVVRTTRGKRRGTLEVLEPFDGTVELAPDTLLAQSASIDEDGGTISATGADGTLYELIVPADAVDGVVLITMTPAASISGLPLTGTPAFGATFAPDGLEFLVPAKLRITPTDPPSGKFMGFVQSTLDDNAMVVEAVPSGGAFEITVEHFSAWGGAPSSASDFAFVADYYLNVLGALTLDQMEDALDQVEIYRDAFGRRGEFGHDTFCASQPMCVSLLAKIRDNLAPFIDGVTCQPLIQNRVHEMRLMTRYETGWLLADGDAGETTPDVAGLRTCRRSLAEDVTEATKTANQGIHDPENAAHDPLATSSPAAHLTARDHAVADADNNDVVVNLEWAAFIRPDLALLGYDDLQEQLRVATDAAFARVLDQGEDRCNEVRDEGEELLRTLSGIAEGLQHESAPAIFTAINNCRPKVFVEPATASLGTGEEIDFTARSNEPDEDVSFTWTVSAGTITPLTDTTAHFTAPAEDGNVTITATSTYLTSRVGTATATVCSTLTAQAASTDSETAAEEQCPEQEVAVSISPNFATVPPGGTRQFTATVTGTSNQSVTWTTTTSCGSITQSGLYTAPDAEGTYCNVIATSDEDPTKAASAVVYVHLVGAVELTSSVAVVHATDLAHNSCTVFMDGADGAENVGFGGWSGSASCSGELGSASASQSSQVGGSGDGQDWLSIDSQAARTGSQGDPVSDNAIHFTVTGGSVRLSCRAAASADPEGFVVGWIDSTALPAIFYASDGEDTATSGPIPAGEHSLSIRTGTQSGQGNESTSVTSSVSCDFDGPVSIAPAS